MEPKIALLVRSAFVVDGEIQLPGATVEVPRSDAASLVHRGKAVVVDGAGEPASPASDERVDEPPLLTEIIETEEAPTKRTKSREKRA